MPTRSCSSSRRWRPPTSSGCTARRRRWAWTCSSRSTTGPSLKWRARSALTVIGVNNRDLTTLVVDTERTFELLDAMPSGAVVVSESGWGTRAELERLATARRRRRARRRGLMRSADVEDACRTLAGARPVRRAFSWPLGGGATLVRMRPAARHRISYRRSARWPGRRRRYCWCRAWPGRARPRPSSIRRRRGPRDRRGPASRPDPARDLPARAPPAWSSSAPGCSSRSASPFDLFHARESETSTGSGFLVDKIGDILTNYHVHRRRRSLQGYHRRVREPLIRNAQRRRRGPEQRPRRAPHRHARQSPDRAAGRGTRPRSASATRR